LTPLTLRDRIGSMSPFSALARSPLTICVLIESLIVSSCVSKHDRMRINPPTGGSAMSTSNTAPHGRPVRSLRLIFEYEGDRVRLISQQPVEVAVTGFDLHQLDHPGYYVESRDKGGQALARTPARDAFLGSMEVFPEQHDQPITRVDVPKAKGAFTVVIPAPDTTDHVTVIRATPGTAAPLAAGVPPKPTITEVASFPISPSR
jgi:hypothetical protein